MSFSSREGFIESVKDELISSGYCPRRMMYTWSCVIRLNLLSVSHNLGASSYHVEDDEVGRSWLTAGTTFFQMEQDVLLLTDELLAPTLPAEKKEVEGDKSAEGEKKAWIVRSVRIDWTRSESAWREREMTTMDTFENECERHVCYFAGGFAVRPGPVSDVQSIRQSTVV